MAGAALVHGKNLFHRGIPSILYVPGNAGHERMLYQQAQGGADESRGKTGRSRSLNSLRPTGVGS